MSYNACIDIISSRTKCLAKCLGTLHKYFNHRYNYPVYVYYFDDIYDSEEYRNQIKSQTTENTHFINIPYKRPDHLKEEDMFYNRTDSDYAKGFTIKRKGYLHMCHFRSNAYGYPNIEYEKYDYAMSVDDESGFLKELPYDPFEIMANREEEMGALKVGQRLSNGGPHGGHLATRQGLWAFAKEFLLKNNIEPKSQLIKDLMDDENGERNFHFLPWADSYVIKLKMFQSELWNKWADAVNENGGIYRHRWGDNEIISLFYLIYDDKPIYDLKTVDEGYHDQGLFRNITNCAPTVKDRSK